MPYINDSFENFKSLLEFCVRVKVEGIICFGIGVTLRNGNREYFYEKLDRFFPGLKEKYIKEFGMNYEITSSNSKKIMEYFYKTCRENNILCGIEECFSFLNKFPEEQSGQLELF